MEEKNRGLQWSHIEPYCLLRTLLRQLWMLLMAGAACAMAAWIVLSCFVTQQYTSSTTFAVTARASTLYYTNITAAADMASSYTQLLQSRVLRQTMEQDLGMPLDGTVTAQQLGETNLIRVTVTAGTPRQALVLLKAVSDNYGSLSAHVSSTAVLSQLNSPSLSVAPSRSYNVPRICLMAAIAGAALTALGVAWASVSSGTVHPGGRPQRPGRQDHLHRAPRGPPDPEAPGLDGRPPGAAVPPGWQAPAPEPEHLLPGHQLRLHRIHPPHRRKVPA